MREVSTPLRKSAGRHVDSTPPKVPAFPATLLGVVKQQVVAWEAGGGSVGGIIDGKRSTGATVSIEAVQGGMPRPPEDAGWKQPRCRRLQG